MTDGVGGQWTRCVAWSLERLVYCSVGNQVRRGAEMVSWEMGALQMLQRGPNLCGPSGALGRAARKWHSKQASCRRVANDNVERRSLAYKVKAL